MSGPVKGPGWRRDYGRPKKIEAQFDSVCPECGDDIYEGDKIYWSEYHDKYVCEPCRGS